EAADELADDHQVDLALARRAEVRVDVERPAQAEQARLGAHRPSVPARPADRAQQHRAGVAAGVECRRRQRLARGIDRGAAERELHGLDVDGQHGEDTQRLFEHLRPDPVSGQAHDELAHTATPSSASSSSTSAPIGTPVAVSTASGVFSPLPVTSTTTRSDAPITPLRAAALSAPTVTPAAVSPKMPDVEASRDMHGPTSSSGTAYTAPPDARAVATARSPSAGAPIASDRAIVAGRTGVTARSSAKASATGAQPAAWPPMMRGRDPSTRPRRSSCPKPCQSFVRSDPEATGEMTASGSSQPSCSATSKASVF